MKTMGFDKKTFNWHYGFVYTMLQYIFAVGFVLVVCAVVVNLTMGVEVTIPDAVLPTAVAYLFLSIVGFPVLSVIKKGKLRLIEGSVLTYDGGDTLKYDRLVSSHWTAVGHVEERHIYSVSKIATVTKSRFYYVVVGDIDKIVMNNGHQLEKKGIQSVKIPNAYVDMERLRNHG